MDEIQEVQTLPVKRKPGRPKGSKNYQVGNPKDIASRYKEEVWETSQEVSPAQLARFKPNTTCKRLAEEMLKGDHSTLRELFESAEITYPTARKLATNPLTAAWIVQEALRISKLKLAEIYLHVVKRAATSDHAAWAQLAMERFDKDYKKRPGEAGEGARTQINIFSSWNQDELEQFVRSKERKILGEIVGSRSEEPKAESA